MKKCELCSNKINKKNDASITILGKDLIDNIRKNYPKNQIICTDCKSEMLFAGLISVY